MLSIKRRTLLTGTAGLVLGGVVASPATALTKTPPGSKVPAVPGLHARAAARGLFFGSAIDDGLLENDQAYMAHVPAECGVLVGEAVFKWKPVHPEPNRYDFKAADRLMAYAKRHGLRTRGHTLVWHEDNPDWLEDELTATNAEKLLSSHIAMLVSRYRGRMMHWDCVNEVIRVEDGKPGGLRATPWFAAMGPRYIDVAFQGCAQADPSALRVINEYGTDYAIPYEEKRREALLKLLSDLKARNVPVQAVGLQAHLDAARIELDQKVLAKFVSDIASLGLKVIVTELDVRDNGLPADIESRDAAVAAHAKAWLDAVLSSSAVLGVLTWGLSDRRSWLNEKFARPDKLPQRALPLDADLERKPLWSAIAAALEGAPARRV